jgi:hypothetical protein
MANALFCQDNSGENINFSGQPILVGSFITAYDGTPEPDNINYCFEIIYIIKSNDTNSLGGKKLRKTKKAKKSKKLRKTKKAKKTKKSRK